MAPEPKKPVRVRTGKSRSTGSVEGPPQPKKASAKEKKTSSKEKQEAEDKKKKEEKEKKEAKAEKGKTVTPEPAKKVLRKKQSTPAPQKTPVKSDPKDKDKFETMPKAEEEPADNENSGESQLIKFDLKEEPKKETAATTPPKESPKVDYNKLKETVQKFLDNLKTKTWKAVQKEFEVGYKKEPKDKLKDANPDTRYKIAYNVPPDSDFYDATKIEIPGVDNKFIIAAEPGPDKKNHEDFWRMVYDSNVTNIFYLENYEEDAKTVFVPWKVGEGQDFGKMFVNNKKIDSSTRFAVQTVLEVLPEGCSNSIIVRFMQCRKWPEPLFVIGAVLLAVAAAAGNTATSGAKSEPTPVETEAPPTKTDTAKSSAPVASTPEDAVKIVAEQQKENEKSYKVAIFAPYMANSQVIWNKRVGEELLKAGHDVTIYMMYMFNIKNPKIDIDPRIRVVNVNGSFGLDGEKMMEEQAQFAFNDVPIWDAKFRKMMAKFGEMYKSCEVFVRNKEFLADIENSKFDIAFTHMYNFCPIGIIHQTKIPTWVWLNSGALMDNVANLMGVPLPPSYCTPMMMDAGDKLTFVERVKSVIGHGIFKLLWRGMTSDKETAVFRAEFGQDFPDIADLAAAAPLVMVNSNELYDFARPTLSKIVNIGGVGIKSKDAKPLKPEFASRVEKAKGVVVMSFGSIAPMYLMPEHWKEAYFNAFAQFPEIQFFLRYERPEEIADILPPNAYAAKWLPQTDLLLHPKTLGLISHGGYNSVQDVLHAGVPIMATGLFGDQPRNAHLVERLGMGINVHKTVVSKETIANALKRIVEDKSLKANAQRIKSMIATKPISAETLLVRWTEFLAQHQKLDNLVPYGNSLSFFVYHSLDVIVFLSAIILSILALFFFIIRCSLRCCGFCKKCSKVDDKKKNQ